MPTFTAGLVTRSRLLSRSACAAGARPQAAHRVGRGSAVCPFRGERGPNVLGHRRPTA